MPAQLSGILLVAVFALAAVAGTVLAVRLIALSSPSARRPAPGPKAGPGPAKVAGPAGPPARP
jgi:hypothetical protein